MVSVCTVPAREGRSCEHFCGYKTINRIPLPLCQNGHFTLQLCYRRWFIRKLFGYYTPKVKIEIIFIENVACPKRRFSGDCLSFCMSPGQVPSPGSQPGFR